MEFIHSCEFLHTYRYVMAEFLEVFHSQRYFGQQLECSRVVRSSAESTLRKSLTSMHFSFFSVFSLHDHYIDHTLPDGAYNNKKSNGLAPDNLFFHGVACNCVKIQLSHLGLETEFAQCEIQVKEEEWKGVRRKYWHGETYYLPIVSWKD